MFSVGVLLIAFVSHPDDDINANTLAMLSATILLDMASSATAPSTDAKTIWFLGSLARLSRAMAACLRVPLRGWGRLMMVTSLSRQLQGRNIREMLSCDIILGV